MGGPAVIESVEQHRGELEDIAETDLPAADIAEALLDITETED
jgi:hypothetical protein